MILRLLISPVRLMFGLPAFYGMSLGNRCLQIGRWLGIYRGPIHYVCTARPIVISATGVDLG